MLYMGWEMQARDQSVSCLRDAPTPMAFISLPDGLDRARARNI
jgi:hypothetical protein